MTTAVATLLDEPQVVAGVRVARVRLEPTGYSVTAQVVDPPGELFPYQQGDRVRVQLVQGEPGAGVHITGLYGELPVATSAGARELHARGGGDIVLRTAGGKVRLGGGDVDGQIAVALHSELEPDLASLQAQLDTVVQFIIASLPGGAALLAKMAATVPGYTPGYPTDTHEKAPTARPAADVTATPEEGA